MPKDWPHYDLSRQIDCRPHCWHVQESGTGSTILLIHGAGGATQSWRHLLPSLPHYHLIAPDLPGQGFTRLGTRGRCGLDPMAEDLATLIADQSWVPEAIIGHSAGAAIALRLAEILPTPPRAIVGINAALGPFEGMAGWLFPIMAKFLALNPLVPRLFSRLSGGEAQVRRLLSSTGSPLDAQGVRLYQQLVQDRDHVDATLAMMAQWNLEGLLTRLPQISVPALFITGDKDRAVSPKTSDQAARQMPDAQVVHLPDHGHLVHEEAAPDVAKIIVPFLQQQLGGPDTA